MKVLVIALLGLASMLCFVFAWLSNTKLTRELDRLGLVYGCKRWTEETNNSYHLRLQRRIDIGMAP